MTEHDILTWLHRFKVSWDSQDPDGFAAFFAPECAYRDTPFSVPVPFADFKRFWTGLAQEQCDNHMDFERVEVLDGQRAIAFWHAFTTRRATRERLEGDGVMALSFDAAGKCIDLREWQHARVAGSPLVKREFGPPSGSPSQTLT